MITRKKLLIIFFGIILMISVVILSKEFRVGVFSYKYNSSGGEKIVIITQRRIILSSSNNINFKNGPETIKRIMIYDALGKVGDFDVERLSLTYNMSDPTCIERWDNDGRSFMLKEKADSVDCLSISFIIKDGWVYLVCSEHADFVHSLKEKLN